jgi:hypothetical protein
MLRAVVLATLLSGTFFTESNARASLISVDFTAQVSQVNPGPIFGLTASIGDSVFGNFTYDTNAVDVDPTLNGSYFSGSMSFTLNGHTIDSLAVPEQEIFAGNVFSVVSSGLNRIDGVLQPTMDFVFRFNSTIPGDSLPTAPQVEGMTPNNFIVLNTAPGGGFIRFNSLVAINAESVPEPSSMLLMSIAGGALVLRGRRKGAGRSAPPCASPARGQFN